jgi:hypothetical protein
MGINTPFRDGGSNRDEASATRAGRHRLGGSPTGPLAEGSRDRTTERINAADRALAEAHARLRGAGVDPDAINTAFAVARDCLNEAKELAAQARKELSMAHYEWEQATRRTRNPSRYSETATPVVPDTPGLNLCPDPGTAQTPAEFMDALRMYRIWAGKPSYRAMEQQCGRSFAASTIHAALKSDYLPTLKMVQAIITTCGGSEEHQQRFASAWRRFEMLQQGTAHSSRARILYPVSETA